MLDTSLNTIKFDFEDGVATITLNRPDKLNSFTVEMHKELAQVLDWLESRVDLRGLIITGAGRGFCAGQDLSEKKEIPEGEFPDLGINLEKYYKPLILRLQNLPVPVCALVNGVAAGAGMSLALAADLVYAIKSARFIQAFTKIGLVPDAGSSFFLAQKLGTTRALGLSLLAEPLSAEQAKNWGLIWEVIEDDTLDEQKNHLKVMLQNAPTKAWAGVKELVNNCSASLDEQLDRETKVQREMGFTEDYPEGVNAFKEKRAAIFKGL